MPFGMFFYCMVWFTPSDTIPVYLKFLWYLTMYCFFQTSMSVRTTAPAAKRFRSRHQLAAERG